MKQARFGTAVVFVIALALPARTPVPDLSPKTLQAFEHYVQLIEAPMNRALTGSGTFLWIDGLPASRRSAAYSKLRQGEALTAALNAEEAGKPVEVPGALFLHSIGVIFLQGATLDRTMAVLEDYDHHAEIYGPNVRRSKILRHEGDDLIVSRQLFEKKIVTFVLNAEFRVHCSRPSPTRVDCRSSAIRVAEVLDAGRPTEREKRHLSDSDRQWRFRTYARLEERDGGTFFEYELLYVGPELPLVVRWFAGPIVRSFPGEVETKVLEATRRAIAEVTVPRTGRH